jgi:hypothetical protein
MEMDLSDNNSVMMNYLVLSGKIGTCSSVSPENIWLDIIEFLWLTIAYEIILL